MEAVFLTLMENGGTKRIMEFPITDIPTKLARGDTFTLEIFSGMTATVINRHWNVPVPHLRVRCKVDTALMNILIESDGLEKVGDGYYTMPEQTWK